MKSRDEFFPSTLKTGGGYACRLCMRLYQRALYARKRAVTVVPSHRYRPHWKPATEHPTMQDLAWVAGFLEGEGSFGQRDTKVCATQKDPECLYRLQRWFGGSIRHRVRPSPIGPGDVYDWTCYGRVAMGLMLTVYTWMSSRRRAQIRAAVQVRAQRAREKEAQARQMHRPMMTDPGTSWMS
jgi:hypothetical protein